MTATAAAVAVRPTCQYCGHQSDRVDSESLRAAGWRIWSGQTIGGEHRDVVICPVCVGDAPEPTEEELVAQSWNATCSTCDASALEDAEDDDLPLTEEDARGWELSHECEPIVSLIKPKAGQS